MNGLLKKDFYVVTKQLKIFIFLIPVFAIIGGTAMSAFAIMLGAVLPMTAIAYDERSKWNDMAVMMPYTKAELIISKYLLGYLCMFGAALLVLLGQLLRTVILENYANGGVEALVFSIVAGLLFMAIDTPILIKFGSEKGRYVFIVAMALVGASGPILNSLNPEILTKISAVSPFLSLLAAIIINIFSIMIAMSIKSSN